MVEIKVTFHLATFGLCAHPEDVSHSKPSEQLLFNHTNMAACVNIQYSTGFETPGEAKRTNAYS